MIKILPKRTETAGRVPSSADLMEGEIAVNASDKIIFTKVSSGDVVNLTGAPMVHTHSISDVIGLQDDLESKVDKIPGKGLSDENFTTEEKSKLGTIEEGAEVNVGTNLNQSRNGTTYTVSSSTGSDTTLQPADGSFAGVMTTLDRIKLDGIESGAQVNVPTNLNQNRTSADYTITSSTGSDTTLIAATSGSAGVMSATDKTRLDSIHDSYNNSQWDTAYEWGDHAQAGYESLSNKGVANGYAGLDSDGTVPAAQLPSFVNDVLEYSSTTSFPATGETEKLYVAMDTNKVYRWSWPDSSYIYITSGAVDSVNGKTGVVVLSTSDVSEGSRQYFTTARARASINVSGDLSYNSTTGVISYNEPYSSASDLLTAIKGVDGSSSGLDADLLDGKHASAFATSAQGSLANSAVQPEDLASVATSGSYTDLINKPDLSVLEEVMVYSSQSTFPTTGEKGKVYVAEDTGFMYRWNGTGYTQLTDQTAIWGQISGTLSDQTDLKNALNGKANTTTQVIAGTGLSGGGNMSTDRTLSVKYGTTAGTVVQGNDSRLSNSRDWTASTVTQAEAEAGTSTTRRAWTSQRVRHAITGWWNTSSFKTKLDGIEAGAEVNTVDSVNGKTGVVVLSTSDVSEGSRPYFTTARARSAISASGDLSYNSTTGTVSFNETYSTPAEVLSAVKSVDGAGSGLDADLLDGQSGAYYLNFSNFTNVPTYDNYGGWTLRTNGTSRGNVSSGESVNIVGGDNVDVAYSSTNNTITISGADTNTNNYLNSLSFNTGNGILTAGMNGLGDRTVDLDGRYLLSGSKAADSDKLDNLNSSQFLRSDTDDTTTGTLTFNKTGALTVLNSTLVSSADAWHEIGNGTYGWKLKYVGSTSGTDGNEFRIESTSNTSKYFQIDHDGNVDISGNTVWHAGNLNPNDFIASSGTYANLRAQATTKGDVGLGSVRNVASYSQSEANGRFVNDTGDSMTGALRINRADDGISDLQVGGDTAVDGDVNVGGVVNIGGGYEMAYNSSTKSLDFNFVG